MNYLLKVTCRGAARAHRGAPRAKTGPEMGTLAGMSEGMLMDTTQATTTLAGAPGGTLANCQAPGFNKPQRSGLIRTCPDRSTGSPPLEDPALDGVSHSILKGVLGGILKRPFGLTARVTATDRPSRRTLAYIEHEHRSHRVFASITRPSYGDRPKATKSVGPGIVPDRTHSSHPVISRAPREARTSPTSPHAMTAYA